MRKCICEYLNSRLSIILCLKGTLRKQYVVSEKTYDNENTGDSRHQIPSALSSRKKTFWQETTNTDLHCRANIAYQVNQKSDCAARSLYLSPGNINAEKAASSADAAISRRPRLLRLQSHSQSTWCEHTTERAQYLPCWLARLWSLIGGTLLGWHIDTLCMTKHWRISRTSSWRWLFPISLEIDSGSQPCTSSPRSLSTQSNNKSIRRPSRRTAEISGRLPSLQSASVAALVKFEDKK